MKYSRRITALILATVTALVFPLNALAFTSKSIFTDKTYTHQDRFKEFQLTQGVDVSHHNIRTYDAKGSVYDINWAKVKKAGVSFAIIRIGCRGYASSGKLLEDNFYKQSIEGAYKNGIDVGVYFYSQALNKTEAREEADYVLKRIEPYRDKITMPVYFDYEFAGVSSGRLDSAWNSGKVNRTKLTQNANAFCKRIEDNGFKAGIYASKSFFEDNLYYGELEDKYDIWLAHYTTNTSYKGEFRLWQFTPYGEVKGINGYVDSNFMYNSNTFDDVELQKKAYTGKAIEPMPEISYRGTVLTKDVDYTLNYSNNINYGKASITVAGINKYSHLKKRTYNFEIVPTVVKDIQLTKRKSSALTVKWAPHPDADGYLVRYFGNGGWETAGETQKTETEYTISNLTGATAYSVTVSAIKKVGNNSYSGLEGDALNAVTKPAKVKGYKNLERTSDSLTFTWNEQYDAKYYAVYKYNKKRRKYEELDKVKQNKFTVTGLKTNTKYKFKVKTCVETEKGKTLYGKFGNPYIEYTASKAPVLKSAQSLKRRKITATWKGVKGASGYQVMWSTTPKFTSNYKTRNFKADARSGRVKTARSKARYYVRVRAYIKRGGKTYYSEWSEKIKLRTK